MVIRLLGFAVALILLGSVVSEAFYGQLFDENRLVETSTAIIYGCAAIVAIAGGCVEVGRNGLTRHFFKCVALGLFALFLVAEEVSVWTLFMSTEPPRVLGIRMDAAHDVLHLSLKAIKVLLADFLFLGAALIGLMGVISIAAAVRFHNSIMTIAQDILASRVGTFILLCVVLGLVGLVADLRSETWPILKSVEESLELTASVSLLIAAGIAVGVFNSRSEVSSADRT